MAVLAVVTSKPADLLPALTVHVRHGTGTLAEYFVPRFDAPLADSSWSDRRARVPREISAEPMPRVLRARATRRLLKCERNRRIRELELRVPRLGLRRLNAEELNHKTETSEDQTASD